MRPATRVVLLTPPGRSAVATLLIDGPGSTSTVDSLFLSASRRPLATQPCGRILFGHWPSSAAGEEIVVCRRSQARIEIHCHGGREAARAIMATLTAHGCQEAPWTDWIGEVADDALVADARLALAAAPTERTALHLWQQHEGSLRRAIDGVTAQIAGGNLTAARSGIDELLTWSALGLHLTKPWRVVLTGRPNVGKSSLINALVGYQRAIVHPTPGTTRDVVTAATAVEGWPIELADTAGIRAGGESIERQGIDRARRSALAADLVLLVVDRSRPWSDEDAALAADWPQALWIFNKCDLPAAAGCANREAIEVSAMQATGIDELIAAIARRLVPNAPAPDEALPFLPAQVAAIAAASEALARNDSAAAMSALESLTRR
jgi:tRNA modification GTPase